MPKAEESSGSTIAGFILSIIGLACLIIFPGVGIVPAILGLIFSFQQRRNVALAKAGFIMGIIGIILNFIEIVLFILALALIFA